MYQPQDKPQPAGLSMLLFPLASGSLTTAAIVALKKNSTRKITCKVVEKQLTAQHLLCIDNQVLLLYGTGYFQ